MGYYRTTEYVPSLGEMLFKLLADIMAIALKVGGLLVIAAIVGLCQLLRLMFGR